MNLPNKITISRLVLSFILIVLLIFPFDTIGVTLPKLFINETLVVDIKYFIAGGLFIIASVSDFLDGYIARKYNMVTDLGKMLDAIADKILVNAVLILLATSGFIHPIIPVVIVSRDTIVDIIKMVAGSKGNVVGASILGKIKTILMMCGITLTLFYNLPFELINIKVSNILLTLACIMSVISAVQYYNLNKKYIKENLNDIKDDIERNECVADLVVEKNNDDIDFNMVFYWGYLLTQTEKMVYDNAKRNNIELDFEEIKDIANDILDDDAFNDDITNHLKNYDKEQEL